MQSPQPKLPSRVASEFENVIVTTGHIRAVFRKSLPKPKPEFPAHFMERIPPFNPDALTPDNLDSKDLIDSLGLDLQQRLEIVRFLTNDSEFTDQSRNNQLFSAYLCLQSFSALFFTDIENVTADAVSIFVKGLKIAERYVPELIDLIFRSFYYFYHRLIGTTKCMDLAPAADEFLMIFEEQGIPKYYIPKLIDVSATVLRHLADNYDEYLSTVCVHLDIMAKVLSGQPLFTPDEMTNAQMCLDLSAKMALDGVAKGDGFSDNSITAVRFGIELSRVTSQVFPQIAPYFSAMISTPKVTELTFTGEPARDVELKPATPYSIEGKELTPLENANTHDFAVPEVPDFLGLLNEHPITRVVNSLALISSASQFMVFSLVFQYGSEEIPNGNLNYLAFILLFVYNQKISDVYKAASFLNDRKGYTLFFPDSLFKLDCSIFDEEMPVIVSLRKFAIESFVKLFTRLSDENMLEYFAQAMSSVAEYPHLFAEFMHLSASFLNRERRDSIFMAMGRGFKYIQYALRDPEYPHRYEIASLALKELEKFFEIESFLAAIANSKAGCEMLIELMADSYFADTAENFFRRTFEFTRQFPEMAAFRGLAQACANAIKQHKQISKMFGIVDTILKQSKRPYILEVCKSPLFEAVQTFIVNATDVEMVEIPMKILTYSVFGGVYKEVTLNWKEVATKLGTMPMNDETYKTIRLLLSGNWKSHSGINNGDAIPLISAILKSKYAMEFVQELLGMISSDAIQCLHLFEYNSVPIFLEFLNSNECSPELYEAIMMVVIRVVSFVCDRITFKEFFKIFSPSNGHQNPHTQQLCQYLLSAMIDDPVNKGSMFHFNTSNSFVFLPRLPIELLTEGCAFVFNICLVDCKGSFCLLSLSCGDKYYAVFLGQNRLRVKSSNLAKEMVIPLEYPMNEWFTLGISMKDFGDLTIFIDGVRVAHGFCRFSHWSSGAEKFILFRTPASCADDKSIVPSEGFLGDFWIFKEQINDTGRKKVDLQPTTKENERKLFGWYSPAATQDKRIRNLAPGKTDFAICDLEGFPCIHTFSRVFERYNGLRYVLSLFEQVELPLHEGETSTISDLFGILQFVLEFSEEVQKQMLEMDGFQMIAKYLSNVPVEQLDILVWKKVIMMECSLTNKQLKLSFYKDMVLLFDNWLRANRKVALRCLRYWNEIATTETRFFCETMGIPYLICTIYDRIQNSTIEDKELTIWESILKAVSPCFQDSDLYLVGQLIMKMIDNPEKSLVLLNLFIDAPLEKPATIRNILYEFVNHENVMEASSPQFVLKVLTLFVKYDKEELPRMLSCQIKESKHRSQESNSEFLIAFSNALISRSGLSLTELANVRIVVKLEIYLLPFLLVYLWNCDKEQRSIVEDIFQNLMANPGYLDNLSEWIDSTSLTMLLAYESLISQSLLSILADILCSKALLLSRSFEIIGLIAHATKTDQLQFSVNLANSVLDRAKEKVSFKSADSLIDVMVNFLLSGRKLSYSDGEEKLDLLAIVDDLPDYKPADNAFTGKLNPAFAETALKLLQFLGNNTISSESREKLTGILLLLCDPELNLISEVCPLLDEASKFFLPKSTIAAALVAQLKPRLSEFSAASSFCEKVDTFTELPNASDVTETIGTWVGPADDVVQKLDLEFNCVQCSYDYEPVSLDEVFDLVKHKKEEFLKQCNTKAEDLKLLIAVEPKKTGIRKRWNIIDDCFRPCIFTDTEKNSAKQVTLTNDFIWSSTCERVTFGSRKRGILYLTNKELYFTHGEKSMRIHGADVLCLFWNWHLHIPNAFTIVTRDSKCFLFVITGVKTRDFLRKITDVSMPNCVFIQDQSPSLALEKLGMTRKWRRGTMSNVEYLVWLNILSGRTFLDPEMYPIFPVLFFTGPDGTRQQRDLTKNIAEANKAVFDSLKESSKESPFDTTQKYIFDRSYSSSSVVRSLLKALDRRHTEFVFESPAEFFQKIGTGEIQSELAPEFFMLPELFEGQELPPWCTSAVDFVYQHVQALESPEVTAILPKWIDLIWGVGQQDPNNSYDPRLLANVWDRQIENPTEITDLLQTHGQIPHQLFTVPHPSREEREETRTDIQIMTTNSTKILAFGVVSPSGQNLKVFTAHKNETIYTNEFPGSISSIEQIDLKWLSLIAFSPNISIVYSQLQSNTFSFVNSKRKIIKKPRESDLQLSVLKFLLAGETSVISVAEDNSIYSWDYELNLCGRLFVHNSPITTVELIDHHRTLISCDESGKVVISLIPSLTVVNVIETGVAPTSVVFAKFMGIIIVYSETIAKSYTLNGTPLREKRGRGRITCACSVGDQYAIVLRDEVIICDAFTLEPVKFLYKHPSPITGMSYFAPQRKLVLTTEESQLVAVAVY